MSDDIATQSQKEDTPANARADEVVVVKRPARKSRFDLTHYAEVNAEIAAAILDSARPSEIVADLEEIIRSAYTTGRDGKEHPDFRTRLAAQQLRLHYLLGRPIERQQIVTAQVGESADDIVARLRESPALQDALARMIEDAGLAVEQSPRPLPVVGAGDEMRKLQQEKP